MKDVVADPVAVVQTTLKQGASLGKKVTNVIGKIEGRFVQVQFAREPIGAKIQKGDIVTAFEVTEEQVSALLRQ